MNETQIKLFNEVIQSDLFIGWAHMLEKLNIKENLISLMENQDNIIENIGKKSFGHKIPFLIIYKFTEICLSKFNLNESYSQEIQKIIAKNYLHEKLDHDLGILKHKTQDEIMYASYKQKEIINEHLFWMINLINFIKNGTFKPEMDERHCFVGRNLKVISNDNLEQKKVIVDNHSLIHLLGRSAISFYENSDYMNFLLIYTDLFHHSIELQSSLLQVHLQQQLISMDTDPLTTLGNYFRLRFDLENLSSSFHVFVMNINEFSKINIMFGHKIGDSVLVELANILREFEFVEQVYRIYGDDFAIILNSKEPFAYANTIMENLEDRAYGNQNDANISISLYGSIGKLNPDILMKNEYGLILAKDKNTKLVNVDLIDTSYLQQYNVNMELARQLRVSFVENNIEPFFQPIANIKTKKIVKYEALMRVKHSNGTVSIPGEFLEVLKNMYIYPEFTKTIIKKTFEYFNDLQYEFSVNLSFKDIIHKETKDFIITVLNLYPNSASRCTFELLEYEAVENNFEVKHFLKTIKGFGVKVALDDFGAGYSNYMGVFNFGIDYIKIDGSIIQNLLKDRRAGAILESMMLIAKKLDVEVIAEFVSSKELYEKVELFGVDFAQGYYIGKPSKDLLQNDSIEL